MSTHNSSWAAAMSSEPEAGVLSALRQAAAGTRGNEVAAALAGLLGVGGVQSLLRRANAATVDGVLELFAVDREGLAEAIKEFTEGHGPWLLRQFEALALGRRAVLVAEAGLHAEAWRWAARAAAAWSGDAVPASGLPEGRYEGGAAFVSLALQEIGRRHGVAVGPLRDLLGPPRRRAVLHDHVPLLFYLRGARDGAVLRLRLEALAMGREECYPHPVDMDGHPLGDCFLQSASQAWGLARQLALADHSPWLQGDRLAVDVRWDISGAVDGWGRPIPLEGRSVGAALLVAFYRVLCCLPPLTDHAISLCLSGGGLAGLGGEELRWVCGAFQKAGEARRRGVRFLVVHSENAKDARQAGCPGGDVIEIRTIDELKEKLLMPNPVSPPPGPGAGQSYHVFGGPHVDCHPGAWMPDGNIPLTQNVAHRGQARRPGATCYRAEAVLAVAEWLAVGWLVDGRWGASRRLNLYSALRAGPGARFRMDIWARSDTAACVDFRVGGVSGCSITQTRSTGYVQVPTEWRRFSLDLSGADLSAVFCPFVYAVDRAHNGARTIDLELDEIIITTEG